MRTSSTIGVHLNKIYRILRDASGNWVVASELSRGRGKGSSLVAVAISALLSANAIAGDAILGPFNPIDNDNQVGSIIVNNGDTINLTGSLSNANVASGSNGQATYITFQELIDQGKIKSGAELIGPGVLRIGGVQTRDLNITITDPATQSQRTFTVYDTSKIAELAPAYLATDKLLLGSLAEGQQYIDLRLGTVEKTGGTLNIALDNADANPKTLIAKQTALAYADGTDPEAKNTSDINWTSKNSFYFNATAQTQESGKAVTGVAKFPVGGKVTAYNGTEFAMASVDDLKTYNNWLIAELKQGRLDPAKYDAEFKRAVSTSTETIQYELPSFAADDEIYKSLGLVNVVRASGAKATGTLTKTGSLTVTGSQGGIMRADQGGKIVNDGALSMARTTNGPHDGNMFVVTDAGSQGVNNGVINANLTLNDDGGVASNGISYTVGALVSNGAHFENGTNGVINVATGKTRDSGLMEGIRAETGAETFNQGTINVGVTGTTASAYGAVGARVLSGGSFVNETDGTIYIGRTPQSPEKMAASDVALTTSGQLSGISIEGSGLSAENAGRVVIGTQTHGATAMKAMNTRATGTLTNSGTIDILGAVQDVIPSENIGMAAINATNVLNEGTINVGAAGQTVVNAIGLKAYDEKNGGASKITSIGQINILGNASLDRRNYGAWAQGARSEVELSGGAVNLQGDGAIGVHAREGGKITVDGGAVNFLEGEQQIGFFAFGEKSVIDVKTAPAEGLKVETAGSTLFRIEDGATFNTAPGTKLIASGERSTALHETGVGSTANLNGMSIEVSGKDAVAVRVDGGATGSMSGQPGITLKNDGAIAVVVDNNKRTLNGIEQASAPGVQSTFTNNATAFEISGAQNMTAFQVKNGAKLVNAGDIHVAHGTAIEIVGAGSSVVADDNGKRGTITVDDGVAGIHVHGGATLDTADTITVNGSASGVLVGSDAGRVVIEKDAHITGLGTSYGNLVTNQAAAGNTLVNGAKLEMRGAGAALLSENNLDAASHGQVLVSSQSGGKGIALSKADGTTTSGSFNVGENWQIDVTGNGAGVYANTSGVLNIDSRQITVSGAGNAIKSDAASLVSVSDKAVITGTNADAKLIVGDMDQLYVGGAVHAVDANATAIALGAGNTTAYITGSIVGQIDLGAGDDTVILEGAKLDGALMAGDGANTVVLKGPTASTFTSLDGGTGSDIDTLIFDNYSHVLDDGNVAQIRNFENVNLTNASTLDLRTTLALGDGGNGNGTLDVGAGSTLLAFNGPAAVQGHLANAGLVNLSNGMAGNTLTVHGNYVGNGGVVKLDTVLGDDSSPTDKLVVHGSTSGNTGLQINKVGDTGAHTSADGIQVVQVDGASDGHFALTQRAVAGAREYLLVKGGKANPADGDWYLRSEAPKPPVDPVDPQEPSKPGTEEPTVDAPAPAPAASAPVTPLYRPEAGAYLGNQHAASTMFMHTLHDRLGEVDFTERQRGNGQGTTAGWARVQGNRITGGSGGSQIDMSTNSYVLQGGAELGRWNFADSRFHAGVMFGTGQATTDAASRLTGYRATGKVDGASVGVYGTWYQNASKPTGLYVDSWLQYGRFNNEVKGDTLSTEKYKSSTLSASIEAGYAFEVHSDGERAVYVEPQAQVVYTDYRASDHIEANGTVVRPDQAGGLQTRLGARVYTRPVDGAKNRVQPFVEANWLHASRANAVSMSGDVMTQDLPRDRLELKVGAQVEMARNWTTWGHLGAQLGAKGYQSLGGQVGVKYTW